MGKYLYSIFTLLLMVHILAPFGNEQLQTSDLYENKIIEIDNTGLDFFDPFDDTPSKYFLIYCLPIILSLIVLKLSKALYLRLKSNLLIRLLLPVFNQSNNVVRPLLNK